MHDVEVVVVGGGIAGVSAAYALSLELGDQVRLIEAETTLAFHTTGRSAAQLIENYGAAPIRQLTGASLDFLSDPPEGLTDAPLLTSRGILTIGGPGTGERIDAELAAGRAINPTIVELGVADALALVPVLRPEAVERCVWEPQSSDIDVAGLHQAFVRGLRRAGATIAVAHRLDCAVPDRNGWRIETTAGTFGARHLVNAAGAWGDVVAERCGVEPVGLEPRRRTALMVRSPHPGSHRWPLVAEVDHSWYVKPDGEQLLCSPADETPSEPCDARPDELDVALAIERINAATTLGIRSVASTWAGLRTFAPDRSMVIGPDPDHPTFHWCVGQGGTGIQTSPGAGRLTADLVLHGRSSRPLDLQGLLPDRLRR